MGIADTLLKEKLEVLDGSRSRDRRRAAVRVEDIGGLLDLPPTLKSTKAAGSAPTKAEYDALVADVHALHGVLARLSAELQKKVRP